VLQITIFAKQKNKKMTKRILLSTLACMFMVIGTQAQTEVTTGVTYGKKYGVTYMLPRSVIEIKVQATQHHFTPGELGKYANRYLRLKDVGTEEQTYWTMDGIEVKSRGVADKENIYFVELKDKTVAPLMELTEEGTIYSINLPFSGRKAQAEETTTDSPKKKVDPRSFLTEEILMTNSSAKMAELVAREIYAIRESKNALLRGEADNMPQDGAQLQIMLDNLNTQETSMTEMFSGFETEQKHVFTVRLEPEVAEQQVAFRFSQKLGLVDKDNLAGEPIYITLTNQELIAPEPIDAKGKKLDGVAYNVPGKAEIAITYKGRKIFSGELPIVQFGTIEYLAGTLFNKGATTTVQFDPETGALVKVDRE